MLNRLEIYRLYFRRRCLRPCWLIFLGLVLTLIAVTCIRRQQRAEGEAFDEHDIIGRYGVPDGDPVLRSMDELAHARGDTTSKPPAGNVELGGRTTALNQQDDDPPVVGEPVIISGQDAGSHRPQVSGDLPYFLIGCAKATWSEIPYLLEWLEYHRLQGMDKMVVYIDDVPFMDVLEMKRQYRLIEDYYQRELKQDAFLEIKTSGGLTFDTTADIMRLRPRDYSPNTAYIHRLNQQTLVQHCWRRFRTQTEWFTHIDVDEFLYVDIANVTLRQYLRNFYVGGTHHVPKQRSGVSIADPESLASIRDQETAISHRYLLSSLSGIYIPTLNFGLGGLEHVFSPAFRVGRNLLTGNVEFFASNTKVVPNVPPAFGNTTDQVDADDPQEHEVQPDTAEGTSLPGQDIRDLTAYLQKRCSEPSYEAFADLLANSTQHAVSKLGLISRTCQRTVPNSRFGTSPTEILEIQSRMRPDCRPLLEVFNNTKGFASIKTRSLPGMRKFAGKKLDQAFPVSCYPSALNSRLTTMGKTILWTGRRYQPPKGFNEQPSSPLYPYRTAERASQGDGDDGEDFKPMEQMANVPFPPVARRSPMTLNRFNLPKRDRMTLDRIWYESGSLVGGVAAASGRGPGHLVSMLPGKLSYRAYPGSSGPNSWLSVAPLSKLFGWERREVELLSGRNVPSWYCEVAWVHGCAHRVRYPLMISPANLRVNHYMLRALEARTISDVGWRKGATGWGKFGADPVEFTVLEYATAVAATNASLDPDRLEDALSNRYNIHFHPVALSCTKTGVKRSWPTPCQRTCPSHHPVPWFNGTACGPANDSHNPDVLLCAVDGQLPDDLTADHLRQHLGYCCT